MTSWLEEGEADVSAIPRSMTNSTLQEEACPSDSNDDGHDDEDENRDIDRKR